jgi:thiamine-phosphate pyrophosphorylase
LHVALVSGKRLSEALRCVEEYGKVIAPEFAGAVEKIRYRGYELERHLHVISSTRARFYKIQLYVIITESLSSGDWYATAEAALKGGADCLQLREKNLADGELLGRAKRLATLCHEREALFVVNDRPDIAALSGADGVHLGQGDLPIASARRMLPPSAIVGVSTHTVDQVQEAVDQAPDYIAVGPMFDTATKPPDHIAGPETLTAARERTSLPLVAIGGISENNVDSIVTAAHCIVCVCSAVIGASDVRTAASRLKRSMRG